MRILSVVILIAAAVPAWSNEIERFDFCLSEAQALSVARIYAERGAEAAFQSVTYRGALVDCRRDTIERDKVRLVGKKRIVSLPVRAGGVVRVDQVIVADPWFQPRQAVYRISFEPAIGASVYPFPSGSEPLRANQLHLG